MTRWPTWPWWLWARAPRKSCALAEEMARIFRGFFYPKKTPNWKNDCKKIWLYTLYDMVMFRMTVPKWAKIYPSDLWITRKSTQNWSWFRRRRDWVANTGILTCSGVAPEINLRGFFGRTGRGGKDMQIHAINTYTYIIYHNIIIYIRTYIHPIYIYIYK